MEIRRSIWQQQDVGVQLRGSPADDVNTTTTPGADGGDVSPAERQSRGAGLGPVGGRQHVLQRRHAIRLVPRAEGRLHDMDSSATRRLRGRAVPRPEAENLPQSAANTERIDGNILIRSDGLNGANSAFGDLVGRE